MVVFKKEPSGKQRAAGVRADESLQPSSRSATEDVDSREVPLLLRSIDVVAVEDPPPEPHAAPAPAADRTARVVPPTIELGGCASLAWLVVVRAEGHAGKPLIPLRRWLRTRGEVVIGREGADISFGNLAISKDHARISLDPRLGFTIRDLNSTNGTFIAPEIRGPFMQLTAAVPLHDRSALRLGDVLLIFRSFLGAPGSSGSYGGS